MSEEKGAGEKVPVWIISFADMITLLLSFFVMLQTMSHSRDATLFGVSQGSFRRSIAGLGIPDILFGKQAGPSYDYRKLKYPTDESTDDVPPHRVIDADDEQIRKLFDEINRQMETRTSNSSEQLLQVTAAPLAFVGDGRELESQSQEYLLSMAGAIRQNRQPDSTKIYIVALLRDQSPSKDQWLLSAQRAAKAGEALQRGLSGKDKNDWNIATWSCPAGRGMVETFGQVASKSSYLIVIMGAANHHGG